MSDSLASWDASFEYKLNSLDRSERQKAGALLAIVPSRVKWEDFLVSIKAEWYRWQADSRYPYCLIVLYGGLSFYEYKSGNFWQPFAQAIGCEHLDANHQTPINLYFEQAANDIGLKILRRENSTDYVGSSVYHIGIPLSLWDDFLKICEWTLWHDEWHEHSDAKWKETIERLAGSRTRLKNFLSENRETATALIQELHDARKILSEDENLTINAIKQVCLLRSEYFDEVPETAEFLRPSNPDSLFRDRARLVWDEDRARIRLDLPAVVRDKLPAVWQVSNLLQPASATSNSLQLNETAFNENLTLTLTSGTQREAQRLRGLAPFGMFDVAKDRFINTERDKLPRSTYILIAPQQLCDIKRKDFDEEEYPPNESYELEDGTICYVTRLIPTGKRPQVSFQHQDKHCEIHFSTGARIEARLYVGEGVMAAGFDRHNDMLKVERLPVMCVAIPHGFSDDNLILLQKKFSIRVEGLSDYQSYGVWEKQYEDEAEEYYFWKWSTNLPNLSRKRIFRLQSLALGINFEQQLEIRQSKNGLQECWQDLPGAMLPFFLLCQTNGGMRWEELLLAQELLAPQRRVSQSLLLKYERYGLLKQRGQKWMFAESRAVMKQTDAEACELHYCGEPNVLWNLFRYMFEHFSTLQLPKVVVVNRRGELPFMQMSWKQEQQERIKKYLTNKNVRIAADLWEA